MGLQEDIAQTERDELSRHARGEDSIEDDYVETPGANEPPAPIPPELEDDAVPPDEERLPGEEPQPTEGTPGTGDQA